MKSMIQGLVLVATFFISFVEARPKEVSINFRDTDIQVVIETMAKMTGKNFLVDG